MTGHDGTPIAALYLPMERRLREQKSNSVAIYTENKSMLAIRNQTDRTCYADRCMGICSLSLGRGMHGARHYSENPDTLSFGVGTPIYIDARSLYFQGMQG